MAGEEEIEGVSSWDMFLPVEKATKSSHKKEGDRTTDNQDNKKDAPLFCRISVAVLGVLTVILLIILLALVCEWRNIRDRAIQRHETTMCGPVKSWGNCPGDLTAEGELCCGRTNLVISALINNSTVNTFRENSGARLLTEPCALSSEAVPGVPIAKLIDLDMPKTHLQGKGTSIFWNTSHPGTILSGVEYEQGRIKILYPGHYNVYSHVSLHKNAHNKMQPKSSAAPHTTDSTESHSPFFSHAIYRQSPTQGREKLIESLKSECDTMTDENTLTSFTGSVFRLFEGDSLSVETSHPQHLMKSGSNYFELYAIEIEINK